MKCAAPFNLLLILALSLTVGCAGHYPKLDSVTTPAGLPAALELRDTPFFPQEEYQCGPAALATTLVASGAAVSPDELAGQVYLPGREGSLQVELVAATRRYGRLPYMLDGELAAVLAELAAGRPVLVLQNLGVASYPLWHYAVVVGYDVPRNAVVLRSGTEKRATMNAGSFIRSWDLANRWALVTLPPGTMPANPGENRYLDAVTALEGVAAPELVAPFYTAAARRWPDNPLPLLGLANTDFAMGRAAAAEKTLRQLLALHPDYAVARNNLAHMLALRGCNEAALAELELGLAETPPDSPLHRHLLQTRADIVAGGRVAAAADCPPASAP